MLSIGFIVGSIICRQMQGHMAYAAETDCKKYPADCDPPYTPPPKQPPKGYHEKCGPMKLQNGKVISACIITDPLNRSEYGSGVIDVVPGAGLDPGSDYLHPSRGKDEKGYAILPRKNYLEYPTLDPDDPNNPGGKNKSPLIQTENIPVSPSDPLSTVRQFSEYARAYRVTVA